MTSEFLTALQSGSSPVVIFAALFAATFVQEDAATVGAGLLASRMVVDPALAITAVVAGTAVGDIALHAAGRWLSNARLVARLRARSGSIEARLSKHGLIAVGLARFIPGTRLPVFLASGLVRTPFAASFAIIFATTLLWTPGLFLLGYGTGGSIFAWTQALGWLAAGAAVLGLLPAFRGWLCRRWGSSYALAVCPQ